MDGIISGLIDDINGERDNETELLYYASVLVEELQTRRNCKTCSVENTCRIAKSKRHSKCRFFKTD